MTKRAWTDNEKAALLAAAAGVLMLASGVTGAAQWQRTFETLQSILGPNPLLHFVQLAFVVLGSLGGALVLLAAYALREDRVRTGKALILLGTGLVLVHLVIFVALAVRNGEWPFAGASLLGFVGVLLSIAARFRAKAKPLRA